ncbi:hypothetical protein SteCoe_753 [Stentor coeruleus]|uniref:Ras-related protein Rab-7b n=1 Tax=Stentor coeruleus TaxID=5963 RepID=A0A1R2D351_9CILI|nr:hypothetical protein SteCoe_753 [Stentor coeruleus]
MKSVENFKIILLGSQAVGKTSLLEKYVKNTFTIKYKATIGVDFLSKCIDLDNTKYSLQIWDTAGQEAFQSLSTHFYRGSDACVIVFDITSSKTFDSVSNWIDEIQFHIGYDRKIPMLVIGNKLDLNEKRVVNSQKAKQWCEEHGIMYYECSAMTGQNIEEAFINLVKAIDVFNKENPRQFNPSFHLKRQNPKKNMCLCKN